MRGFSTRLKFALSIALLMLALGALDRCLDAMNQSSDLALYGGAAGALSLMVVVPAVLSLIWRPRILRSLWSRSIEAGPEEERKG